MGKIQNFRKVLALPEVVQSVELTKKLKDAYTDYLELVDENKELKENLKTIKDISNIKKNAKVKSGYYTLDGVEDIEGNEIPFCLNCLYEYDKQIPMIYGIVERGVQDFFSGKILRSTVYGITCNKCKSEILINKKQLEKNNG